ncbi:unnamed protein product [Trichogramma brassicae]|uniref:BESS domain-containing protein n=1 Tax=Trichogramma brassicae TaxID=86971 RepID=A0A6H5I205_9HYME|nr:unnamed protein product [Trichogramma brassicae]
MAIMAIMAEMSIMDEMSIMNNMSIIDKMSIIEIMSIMNNMSIIAIMSIMNNMSIIAIMSIISKNLLKLRKQRGLSLVVNTNDSRSKSLCKFGLASELMKLKRPTWPYFQSLQFLDDRVIERTSTSGNLDDLDSSSDEAIDEIIESETSVYRNSEETESNVTSIREASHISSMVSNRENIDDFMPSDMTYQQTPSVPKQTSCIIKASSPPSTESDKVKDSQWAIYFSSLLPHTRRVENINKLDMCNEINKMVNKFAYDMQPAKPKQSVVSPPFGLIHFCKVTWSQLHFYIILIM